MSGTDCAGKLVHLLQIDDYVEQTSLALAGSQGDLEPVGGPFAILVQHPT